MEKRTIGIVATVVTALLCGCPGLASLCFSAYMAYLGASPAAAASADINDPRTTLVVGIGLLCLSILAVAVPFVVGFFTLREKPIPAKDLVIDIDEPIPPAI